MTDVQNAEQILVDLKVKRQQAAARKSEIAQERKSLAYAARADGDVKAGKRLDALNLEGATIAGEVESLDAAIAEATRRLEAARQAEALEEDRANARELRKVLGELEGHGRKVDEALAALVASSRDFDETLNRMHRLGNEYPSDGQVFTNAVNVIWTALMQIPWHREFHVLAPHQKRSFAEMFNGRTGNAAHNPGWLGWREAIEGNVRRRLGEPQDEAA
jgi:hypothetical protein